MSATESRSETAGGHVDRRDVRRGAAAIVARLALDHPDQVERAAVLDIIPTHYLFSRVDKAFAEGAYHWFFFARPAPFPETVTLKSLDLLGEHGSVARRYDALAIWRERTPRVSGKQMPGGHSFHESHLQETAAELRAFLSA